MYAPLVFLCALVGAYVTSTQVTWAQDEITITKITHPRLTQKYAERGTLDLFLSDLNSILEKIKNTPSLDVVSVSNEAPFILSSPVLKANRIVFDDLGEIRVPDERVDFIAVVAKEVTFSAPHYRALIQLDPEIRTARPGSSGRDRKDTPPDLDRAPNKHSGGRGTRGYQGGNGGHGETHHLPPVLLIAGKVSYQPSTPEPGTFLDLRMRFDGLAGGRGGDGGQGGRGGRGQDGGHGVTGLFDCKGGPGNGGNGGMGGPGGRGGDGGDGGNGADVYLIGPQGVLWDLELARVVSRGGSGGLKGYGGTPGEGGSYGARGSRRGHCNGGVHGLHGPMSNPAHVGDGQDSAVDGRRGEIFSIEYDVGSLY